MSSHVIDPGTASRPTWRRSCGAWGSSAQRLSLASPDHANVLVETPVAVVTLASGASESSRLTCYLHACQLPLLTMSGCKRVTM